MEEKFKSGFVSILGRTNVGKSTIVNALVGEKIAAVANKVQTTRTAIRGIVNRKNSQIIFIDTPGIHKPKSKLGETMVETAFLFANDVDVIIFVIDATSKEIGRGDSKILEKIKQSNKKTILAINKIDMVKNKEELLELINLYQKEYDFVAVVPISATKKENIEILLQEIEKSAPSGDKESYNLCLIEGYRILNSEEAAKNMVRLCEICEKTASEDIKRRLTTYMAYGYETTGEMVKSAEKYMDMLTWTDTDAAREEIYKKLVSLRQEMGEADAAGTICRQGIEELKGSVELRLMHIAMQCADEGIEREVCAQTVRGYIEEMPEITEEEAFKKLVREYGIVIEGEDIWVGR